jgi:AraC-type DNA-binding domain-containing proteins
MLPVGVGPRPPAGAPIEDHPHWLGHVKAAPAPPLARYVDYYWISRWDRRGQSGLVASALLDPCVHLQVQDGRARIVGVVRGTFNVPLEGESAIVGIRFRPGGFFPFVRQPVARWTDTSAPAEEVFGTTSGVAVWAREIWAATTNCRGGAEAHAELLGVHLDAFLESHLQEHDAVAEEVASLVALVSARTEVRRVGDLAEASGRSERTLQRLFLRYVGVSPAWVIRRYRLHAAAQRLIANPGADMSTLAHEAGYSDQAHFIHAFRDTIGMTPGAYVKARGRG